MVGITGGVGLGGSGSGGGGGGGTDPQTSLNTIAIASAQADLDVAEASLVTAQSELDVAEADIVAIEAALSADNATQAELDAAVAAREAAQVALEAAQDVVDAAQDVIISLNTADRHPDDDVETVTGTAVDITDPRNPIIDILPDMGGADGTTIGAAGKVPEQAATDNTKFLRGDGTWQTVAGSGVRIDASAGAVAETLSASTDAATIRQFVNIDVTNTATLSVQSGETLNGVTDGTFLFSDYEAGTQFRADEVTGGWVVAAVSSTPQANVQLQKTTIHATFTQNLDANSADYSAVRASTLFTQDVESPIVAFDTAEVDVGGMSDLVNNRINIAADGFYDLDAKVTFDDGTATTIYATQIVLNGTEILSVNATRTPGTSNIPRHVHDAKQGVALVAGDYIELRAKRWGSVTSRPTFVNTPDMVSLSVTQTANQTVVLPDALTPESLDYFFVSTGDGSDTITSTSGFLSFTDTDFTILDDGNGFIDAGSPTRISVKKDGRYKGLLTYSVNSQANVDSVVVRKNGTDVIASSRNYEDLGSHETTIVLQFQGVLSAGDYLEFGDTDGTLGATSDVSLSIEQLPTSTIVMPESATLEDLSIVRATNAPQVTLTSTPQKAIWGTSVIDTTSSYDVTTGEFTAPSPGVYKVSARGFFGFTTGGNIAQDAQMHIYVNGVIYSTSTMENNSETASLEKTIAIEDLVPLDVGDAVDIRLAMFGTITGIARFLGITQYGSFTVQQLAARHAV